MQLSTFCRFLIFSLLATAAAAQQPSPAVRDALAKAQESTKQLHFQDSIKIIRSLPKDTLKTCFQCVVELAVAENGLGQNKPALESVNHAIDLAVTAQEKETAHRLKGSTLLNASASDPKLLTAAETEFRASLEFDPKDEMSQFLLGTTLLKEKRDEEGIKVLKAFVESGPSNKGVADYARRMIAQPRRARERFAPEFELTTVQGEHYSLKVLAGHVVVLDFWATWCPPCRESVPELKELSRKYADKKLVIISISNDEDNQKWRDFISKKQMSWPQFFDQNRKISLLFNVHSFPTYMIIDGDGAIVKELNGLDEHQTVAARLKDTLRQMKELE